MKLNINTKYLILLTFVLNTNILNAQSFEKPVLHLYNDYLSSPAFISAKKTIQINAIGSSFYTNINDNPKEFMINTLANFKKINSGFIVSYHKENKGAYINNQGVILGYAYHQKIHQDLKISIGVSFDIFNYKFKADNQLNIPSNTVSDVNYKVGLGLKYKNLSLSYTLHNNNANSLDTNLIWSKSRMLSNSGFIRYNIQIKDIWHFYPQLSFYDDNTPKLIPGLTADYKDIVGLGFEYWNNINITASVKIIKRIKLIMLIKHENYTLIYDKNSGWNLLGQLQLDL